MALVDDYGRPLSVTSLAGLYPVFSAEAVPLIVDRVTRTAHLAVRVELRPTSHQDVLLVYEPPGRLIYEEIIERQGSLWGCVDSQGPMANTINLGATKSFAMR